MTAASRAAVEAVLLNGGGLGAVINRGHIAKAMLELLGNNKLPGIASRVNTAPRMGPPRDNNP